MREDYMTSIDWAIVHFYQNNPNASWCIHVGVIGVVLIVGMIVVKHMRSW